MSRIANRIILLPPNVKINLTKGKISAHGPLGHSEELIIPPEVEIIQQANEILTKSPNTALAGTYNSLISNLIEGTEKGYERIVEVRGSGYKVIQKEEKLEFSLGKSHLDYVTVPAQLEVKLERNRIIVKGLSKQRVTAFVANDIRRSLRRMPSIYKKNKGIYYLGE